MSRPSPFNDKKPIAPARAYLTDVNIDTDTNTNNDTSTNVDTNVNRYRKKERFEDTHTRQTYYIDNELIKQLHEFAGNERGIKTRFVNDAIKEHFKSIIAAEGEHAKRV